MCLYNRKKEYIMKKLLALLLAGMTLVALTACGGDVVETDVESAAGATVVETEAETETETETEPPETEPPMVEVFTSVYVDNFDDAGSSKWKSNVQMTGFEIKDGYIITTSTGGDPSIAANGFELNCADINAIRVRFINNTPDSNFQIFFTTDTTTSYCEPASFKDTTWYSDSGVEVSAAADSEEWNEMVIYTESCDLWTGTLKNMRIDLSNGEGLFIVDSISFDTVTLEPAA